MNFSNNTTPSYPLFVAAAHRVLTHVFLTLAAVVTLGLFNAASAHSTNESYVYFNVAEDSLTGRVEVTMTDLAKIAGQNAETSAPLSKEAVTAGQADFQSYIGDRISLSLDGTNFDIQFNDLTFLETPEATFAQFNFDVQGFDSPSDTIDMGYGVLFNDIDPTHRGFALIESNARTGAADNESFISLLFGPGDGVQTLNLNDEPTKAVALRFLIHGVWHIWLGFDHVLFLVTLLLTSVMVLSAGAWQPSGHLRESLLNTVKIVTVFTVAHTVTLTLATFEIITLPIVLVEAIIALSIAVVALGNLMPKFHFTSWKVVFVFGLFHGFGFANVLAPLGLDPARKAVGLATFNIGVELGQLAIVIVLFPILFMLRKTALYRVVALQIGSVLLIAIALFWFVERTIGGFGGAG